MTSEHTDLISGTPPPKNPVQWTRFPKDKKRKAK